MIDYIKSEFIHNKIAGDYDFGRVVNTIHFFNTMTKNMKYNKHYGIGHAGKNNVFTNEKIPLLPIAKPYKYVNVPL